MSLAAAQIPNTWYFSEDMARSPWVVPVARSVREYLTYERDLRPGVLLYGISLDTREHDGEPMFVTDGDDTLDHHHTLFGHAPGELIIPAEDIFAAECLRDFTPRPPSTHSLWSTP